MERRRSRAAPSSQLSSAFIGFRFPPEVIVLAVHWYLRFGLFESLGVVGFGESTAG